MSHANAALTPRARLRVARLVVEEGWPVSEVAARFQCSWPTVKRWVDRYRAGRPMTDRSSRPRSRPHRTPKAVVKRVVSLRMHLREGPVQRAVSCQRPRSHGRASPVRQRRRLPLPGLESRLPAAGYQGQAHPPLPTPDQRQDRALPPYPVRRLGHARHYDSETQRRQALPAWLHLYNHHRPHTATQDHPPITRLTNLPDQYR